MMVQSTLRYTATGGVPEEDLVEQFSKIDITIQQMLERMAPHQQALAELRDIQTDLRSSEQARDSITRIQRALTEIYMTQNNNGHNNPSQNRHALNLWEEIRGHIQILDTLYLVTHTIVTIAHTLLGGQTATDRGTKRISRRKRKRTNIPDIPKRTKHKPGYKDTNFGYKEIEENWYRGAIPIPEQDTTYTCTCSGPQTADGTGPCTHDTCEHAELWTECTHHRCGNQRIQQGERAKTDIQYSTGSHGSGMRGLHAAQNIEAQQIIGEYTGEIINREEYERRNRKKTREYAMELEPGIYIDAEQYGSQLRFANHRCGNANATMQQWTVAGETRVIMMSTRYIGKGEEITYNYIEGERRTEQGEYPQGTSLWFDCSCRSTNCIGNRKTETVSDTNTTNQKPKTTHKKRKATQTQDKEQGPTSKQAANTVTKQIRDQQHHGIGDDNHSNIKRLRTITEETKGQRKRAKQKSNPKAKLTHRSRRRNEMTEDTIMSEAKHDTDDKGERDRLAIAVITLGIVGSTVTLPMEKGGNRSRGNSRQRRQQKEQQRIDIQRKLIKTKTPSKQTRTGKSTQARYTHRHRSLTHDTEHAQAPHTQGQLTDMHGAERSAQQHREMWQLIATRGGTRGHSKGGGDCFFSCIQQIPNHDLHGKSIQHIRDVTAEMAEETWGADADIRSIWEAAWKSQPQGPQTITQYVREIRGKGWADNLAILMISKAIHKQILIWTPGAVSPSTLTWQASEREGRVNICHVSSGPNGGSLNHYEWIREEHTDTRSNTAEMTSDNNELEHRTNDTEGTQPEENKRETNTQRWLWKNRLQPHSANVIKRLLEENSNDTVIIHGNKGDTNTNGNTDMLLTKPTSITHAEKKKHQRIYRYDLGMAALADNTWIGGDLIWHTLQQIGRHKRTSVGKRKEKGSTTWIADPYQMDMWKRNNTTPDIATQHDTWIIPINIDNEHWVTGVVKWQHNRIHIEDPMGCDWPEIQLELRRILNNNGNERDWTHTHSTRKRQQTSTDCGIFMIGDIITLIEGSDPQTTQTEINRLRNWIAYNLLASSRIDLQTEDLIEKQTDNHIPHEDEDIEHTAAVSETTIGETRSNAIIITDTTEEQRPNTTAPEERENKEHPRAKTGKRIREERLQRAEEDFQKHRKIEKEELKQVRENIPIKRQRGKGRPLKQSNTLKQHGFLRRPKMKVRPNLQTTPERVDKSKLKETNANTTEFRWNTSSTLPNGPHPITWNIGPSGWHRSKTQVAEILQSRPPYICCQEGKLSRRSIATNKKAFQNQNKEYVFMSTSKQTKEWRTQETGKGQKCRRVTHWTSVITLIHRDLQPKQQPYPIHTMGLSKSTLRMIEGRILVTEIMGTQGPGIIINIYQFQASQPRNQQRLLETVSWITHKLKAKGIQFIMVNGDMNATMWGDRQGYANAKRDMDIHLQNWTIREQLNSCANKPDWTWSRGKQKATLDHIWIWERNSETEGRPTQTTTFTTHTRPSPHHAHDHQIVIATLQPGLIPEPTEAIRPQIEYRINTDKLEEQVTEWRETVRIQHGQLTHDTARERVTESCNNAKAQALLRAARKTGGNNHNTAGTNKTIQRLHWAIRELTNVATQMETENTIPQSSTLIRKAASICTLDLDKAHNEFRGTKPRALTEKNKWDPIWQKAFELGEYNHITLTITKEHIQRIAHGYKRGLERLEKHMLAERMRHTRAGHQERIGKGRTHEIRQFFGRMAEPVTLKRIYPKAPARRYPSMLTTNEKGRQWITKHMDLPDTRGQKQGEWLTHQSKDSNIRIRTRHNLGNGWDFIFEPITELTNVLEHIKASEAMDNNNTTFPIYITAPPGQHPYTNNVDKSAQIDYYVAAECTSKWRTCPTGHTDVHPLTKNKEGTESSIHWWCCTCKAFTNIQSAPPEWDEKFTATLGVRRFDGRRFLSLPLSREDLEYMTEHFPRGKAEGRDGIPYELLRWAPDNFKNDYGKAIDEIFAGGEIPEEWNPQLQQYLKKRDPDSFIENLRPVRLLCTPYKGFTSIIDARLKKEMGHLSMIEPSQFGFKQGTQVQEPTVQLQYAIEEQRRRGGQFYLAFLDWYSAFDTVCLERLYMLFEHMGMHHLDVDLLRRAHKNTWVQVRTPWGKTTRIHIQRGTAQGSALSPTLFQFFLNLCLRHIQTGGVGIVHQCGVRRNTTCFADDLALMTTSQRDMNIILNKIKEFATWAGMELCVHKCEIAGYDFATKQTLSTRKIRYDRMNLPHLPANTAVRYLGLRLDVTGDTQSEKQHITDRMQDAKSRLKTHKYTWRQAFGLLNTVIRPIFAYSAAMTAWTHKELWRIQQEWSIMGRYAYGLPNSHNEAPFLLPPERSGIMKISPYVTAAKSALQILQKVRSTISGETRKLIEGEWDTMRKEWGTGDTHAIQSAILLEDSPQRNRNLLATTLKYLGWVGICIHWASLPGSAPIRPHDKEESDNTRTIWSGMWRYIRHCLTVRWETGEGKERNAALARGIRKLVTKGITTITQLKHPTTQDWWVDADCTKEERMVLYHGLEFSYPGTQRHSVKQEVVNKAKARQGQTERQSQNSHRETRFTPQSSTARTDNQTPPDQGGPDPGRQSPHDHPPPSAHARQTNAADRDAETKTARLKTHPSRPRDGTSHAAQGNADPQGEHARRDQPPAATLSPRVTDECDSTDGRENGIETRNPPAGSRLGTALGNATHSPTNDWENRTHSPPGPDRSTYLQTHQQIKMDTIAISDTDGNHSEDSPYEAMSTDSEEEKKYTTRDERKRKRRRRKTRQQRHNTPLTRLISRIETYNEQTHQYRATIRTNAEVAQQWSQKTEQQLWHALTHSTVTIYTGTAIWQNVRAKENTNEVHGRDLLTHRHTQTNLQDFKKQLNRWRTQPTKTICTITETELHNTEHTHAPTVVQDYWDSERRRGRYPPVEIECQLQSDWRWGHLQGHRFKKQTNTSQSQLTDSPSEQSEAEEEQNTRESWLPQELPGTKRGPAIHCQTIRRKGTSEHCIITPAGVIEVGLDRVQMTRQGECKWKMDRAKYEQWKARKQRALKRQQIHTTGVEHEIAIEAIFEYECAVATDRREIYLPAWQLLKHIMEKTQTNTLAGPSIMETHPLTLWVTPTCTEIGDNQTTLLLLDWLEPGDQRQATRELSDRDAILTLDDKSGKQQKEWLEEKGWSPTKIEAGTHTYKERWWETGNKGLHHGESITVWHKQGTTTTHINVQDTPPIPYFTPTAPTELGIDAYYKHLPSGPYRSRPGRHTWTDGSCKTINGVLATGAGLFTISRDGTTHTRSQQVAGPATNVRGEMAALALALQDTDPTEELTIYTDCLLLLDLVNRWRRADFAPRYEEENHPDILEAIIQLLHARRAHTYLIWVAAHSGDPGNETADIAANAGTIAEETAWETDTDPIALYSITSNKFPTLHAAKWTHQVERHARRTIGGYIAARIRQNSEAKSTEMATREYIGGEMLGKVMQEKQIPERAVRDLLQARGLAFPTGTVVARNQSTNHTMKCQLCREQKDTHCHRVMECTEMKDAQLRMHNDIAAAIIREIAAEQARMKPHPTVEQFTEKRADYLWADTPITLKRFQPDGVIWVRERDKSQRQSQIIIIEFTRTYTITDHEMKEAQAIKHNQYHGLESYLKGRMQGSGTKVTLCTLAMSTLALVPERAWEETLQTTGISVDRIRKVMEAGLKACLLAGYQLNNTYRSRMEELRMRQAAAARRKGIG